MDVRLPNGTIIRNVPEGTTRAQLTARLKRNGYDVTSLLGEEERTFGQYAKEAFKGLIPGAVSGIETAIAGAASVLPEEAEQAVRRKVSEVAEPIRETFAPEPGYEETLPRQLSEAVGSTLPFLGAGLAGRLAAAGLGVATGAGEARQRAEQEGATEGERAAATALGIAPGALESLPPVRILRRFGFGKEAIDEVAGLAPSLRRIATAGGEEALQEASTQVLQNLIAKGVYKPEEEIFGGVTEAAELGGGAGAIVGAIAELALGRRLRGVEPPPEAREEGITEEPTPPVTPAAVAEEPRPARVAPTEQMELPLGAEPVQIPMFGEEETAAPTPSLYRPAEEALAGLKPRSRAYKEEAKDLGLKLDRKGNVKPNQFVFEQPETEVPLTQGRFEFEVPQEQPELPLTVQPAEGQMDIFGGVPMPPGGEMPSVPPPTELPVAEEVPEGQFALNLPGIPMERLTPRDRILRAMAITEDRKTVDNLKFATGLPRAELRETLNTLKEEGTIKYRPGKFEWELTPAGADYVRTPRKKIGSARVGRGAAVSVPPAGTETPPSAESTERGMAGAGTPPSMSDVGEGEGEPALTKPDRISERIIFSNAGSDFVKDLYSANPVDAILTNFEDLNTVTPEEINQSREYIRDISQNALRNEFGDEVTLYRGLKGTEERSPVLSYTLDKNVAKFQAEQQGIRTGKIEEIKVPVSKVLSYSEAIGRGTFAEAEVIIPNPAYRMEAIRRAQEKRIAKEVVDPVAELRTRAIDAFDNDQINEKTYLAITDELKKPAPNLARATSLLEGTAKPKREKDVGLKFQRGVETEDYLDPLKANQYVFHAVRSKADIPNIFKTGLYPGSNVSLDAYGQSFAGEGDVVLVFRKEDVAPKEKGYQQDAVTTKTAKPIAVLADTDYVETVKPKPVLEEQLTTLIDKELNLENKLANYGLDKNIIAAYKYADKKYALKLFEQIEASLPDAVTNNKFDPVKERQNTDVLNTLKELRRVSLEQDSVINKLDTAPETTKTAESVLDEFKQYGVPVQRFTFVDIGNEQFIPKIVKKIEAATKPTKHPEWATKFEKDVGGQVVYSDADTALVRGSSILSGQNVYMAVDRKTGMRTRVDIDSFTGKLFTPEQKQRLVDAKKEVVARDTELFNENPDGPFTGAASNVVTSDGLNPNYGNYLSNLMNSMGLGDIRVFLVHPEDVQNQADKYKLYGQYSSAMSAGLDAGEEGSVRPYGPNRKDFYISMKSGLSEGRSLEIIGHELGHLIERVAYNNAPAEVKAAIRAEYDKWLKDTKGKQGAELVRALRNRETAEAQAAKISPDAKLSDSYWRSFSEWFADNTSKWATTSEKPVGIVEKFFADLAKKLRQLVAKITGNEFVPAKSVKDFLDAMGPGSADSWISERTKPSYDPASANAASYSMSPDERIKADRALVNSVGSSQNRLPEPTARIKEGARTAASMVPRWLRRGVFSFESTHQLADMYRPYTDKLDELWDLQNRDGAALRAKMDKVRTISERGRKVMSKYSPAARDRIYNLFLDTTVNQVEVLDSAADPVLKNNAAIKDMGIVMKPATEHSLYKQFSQLPQPVRDLYRDLRLAYLEDANEMEQILSQYLTPSEWQKLQMEFNKKRLPVYLPLYRSGEYKLVYTDKDGETVSRQFETSEEREKAFRQVRASGIPESKIVRKMASEFAASDIPPAGFYGKVVAKLRENDVDEKTIAKLFDLYMDYMPATSVLQLRRKRQNTPGYEPDVLRAYASVGGAYARRLVNMRFMPQINKAFEDLKADLGQGSFWVSYKDSKGRTVRNGYDTDELRQMAVRQAVEDGADRNSVKFFSLSDEEAADLESVVQGQIDFFNNPKLDNYASKAAYFSFTMYMGGNVSSAIIDLTHIPMVVYSLLGGKYGFGRAAASMKRAHRYYMNPNRKLPSEIAELPSVMKRATEDGVLGEQRIMDLAEFNNRFGDFGSKALETKARVDRALGSIFAISDRYNRGLTFISAYELAKNQLQKKGLKGDELLEAAYTDAKRAVYDSYGSSFPKAGPSIMQNGLARLALTFKRFALNRMWLLVKALDQATRGESKEVKNIARAQLLGFYGMAYVFSGAQGLPLMGAFQLLASALNGMFGDDDELYDIQDATRQAVGMFNYRGPINYLLGVDIASRSGWDQMLWRDDPRRIAEVGPATYAMEQMLGPAFSYAVNAPRAFEHFSEGRFSQGMETLTPRVIANMFKAFRYGTEGALTKDNIPVVDDISKYNQFMQLLGFAPTEVGEAYQQAGVAKKFEREILDRRDGLIRRAMMAIVSDDDEGRANALKDIMKFNEKHPGKPITDESISRSVTNHYVKLNQSVNGVRVDPKLAQEIYDQLGYNDETMLDESELEEQEDLATDLLYED